MEKSSIMVNDDSFAQIASSYAKRESEQLNLKDADSTPSPGPVFFSSYMADAFPSYPLDDAEEPVATVFSEPIPAVSTSCKPWSDNKEERKTEKESEEKMEKENREEREDEEEEEEEGQLPMNSTLIATPRSHPTSNLMLSHSHRKRKSKHPSDIPNSKKGKQKKYIPEPEKMNKDDDIWDDTEIMEAWNKGIKKFRKQQRGEPVTESESEVEAVNEEVGPQDDDEACEVSESVDYIDATLDESKRPIVQPLFHSTMTNNLSKEQISESELLEKISTSWYWAGYYMGMYKERENYARTQL